MLLIKNFTEQVGSSNALLLWDREQQRFDFVINENRIQNLLVFEEWPVMKIEIF